MSTTTLSFRALAVAAIAFASSVALARNNQAPVAQIAAGESVARAHGAEPLGTPASPSLVALDPFLVGARHLDNMELAAFLEGEPNLATYAASALSADSTSAHL